MVALSLNINNPLDTIEHLADQNEWSADRSTDDEISLVIKGSWVDILVFLNWREEWEGLHIICSFDMKVPSIRQREVRRLLALLNQQLSFGHFDLWTNDGTLLFRNNLLLTGGALANEAQCKALIDTALKACERYFPAFQFVIWAGRTAEEAILACVMTPMGEA